MTLQDKVVLLTGASSGLGAALAAELRTRGARLVLTARSAERLARNAAPGDVVLPGDLCDEAHRAHVVEEAMRRFGRIDVLINNAGVGLYAASDRAELRLVRQMFEVNFFAPLDLAQRAIPVMRSQGAGTIVNIGSIAGRVTLPWLTLYSAAKFALCSFTEGLRMEFAHEGIHTMLVLPGYIDTGFQDNLLGGTPPASLRGSKRFTVTVEDCARQVVRGIETNAHSLVAPRSGKLLMWLAKLMPGAIESKLAEVNRMAKART